MDRALPPIDEQDGTLPVIFTAEMNGLASRIARSLVVRYASGYVRYPNHMRA